MKPDRAAVGVGSLTRRRSPSMEDYLEATRTLADEYGLVRVTQLSDALNVSKPSVTAAVARLVAENLAKHEKYGSIELTPRGRLVADDVWRRHEALWTFLTEILGISEQVAEREACQLEHYLSPDTGKRLGHFVDFVLESDKGRPKWLEEFFDNIKHAERDPSATPEGEEEG